MEEFEGRDVRDRLGVMVVTISAYLSTNETSLQILPLSTKH